MDIKIVSEDGEPKPDVKAEPSPLPNKDSQLAPINGKLDAILAALNIEYEGNESNDD